MKYSTTKFYNKFCFNFHNTFLSIILGNLNLPNLKALPNSTTTLPHMFVGDEAFPLKCYMMRPFPGKNLNPTRRIFNYRLSRARRVIENSFGIMAKRFRIFRRPIVAQQEYVEDIVKCESNQVVYLHYHYTNCKFVCLSACVAMHNFLRSEDLSAPNSASDCPPGYADTGDEDNGHWRHEEPSLALRNLSNLSSNAHTAAAKEMRNAIAEYFVKEGSVYWQKRMVGLE